MTLQRSPLTTDGPPRAGGGVREWAPPCVLALFLVAGTLKDTPPLAPLPIDLTLLTAGVIALVVVHRLVRPGARIPHALLAIVALWLTFVPGMIGTDSAVSTEKILTLVTFTLVAAVGAVVVLRGEREIAIFVGALVGFGLLVALTGFVFPDPRELESEKIAAQGSSTINVARTLGAAAVVALLAAATRRVRPWTGMLAAAFFVAGMLLTGSRGPVIGVVLSAAVIYIVRPSRVARITRIVAYTAGVAAVAVAALAATTGQFAVQRALVVVGGSGDGSSGARLRMISGTLDLIDGSPSGIGWGRLGELLPPSARLGPGPVQYPHNIVIEILVEAGWIATAVFVVLAVTALAALLRSTASFGGAALAALGVFFLVNSLVSGTVNDNRALFAMLGVGLAVRFGDLVLPDGRTDTEATETTEAAEAAEAAARDPVGTDE